MVHPIPMVDTILKWDPMPIPTIPTLYCAMAFDADPY